MVAANPGVEPILQNHPGEPAWPVRPTRMMHLPDEQRATVQGLGLIGSIVFLLGIFIAGLSTEGPEFAPQVALNGAITCVVGALCAGIAYALLRRHGKVRIREQQRYYELGRLTPLNLEQREALQLDGVHTGMNNWCETLEDWPCEARLPKPAPEFRSFVIYTVQKALEDLDQSWGVLNRESYRNMIDRLFGGMHSVHFARVASGPDAQAMCKRLSDLVRVDPALVAAAAHSDDGQPAKLLWAFDIWRALRMSRDAYAAAIISEQEAWEVILKASAWLHTLFSDLEDYQLNLRVGHAFWSNDLAQVNERKRVLDAFLDNDAKRPIRDLPWRNVHEKLPDYVLNGFEAARQREELESKEAACSEPLESSTPPKVLN